MSGACGNFIKQNTLSKDVSSNNTKRSDQQHDSNLNVINLRIIHSGIENLTNRFNQIDEIGQVERSERANYNDQLIFKYFIFVSKYEV